MSAVLSCLGVVLAAGRSRRMGYDKAFAEFGGTTLIDYVLYRLSEQLDDVIVNTHCNDIIFSCLSPPLLKDREPFVGCGPLSGVYAALHYIKTTQQQFDGLITVAVDTPFFPENYVARLCEAARLHPHCILIARSNAVAHPTFALWPCDILPGLRQYLQQGNYSVLSFAKRIGVEFVDFTPDKTSKRDAFFNINRREDLYLAQCQQISSQREGEA